MSYSSWKDPNGPLTWLLSKDDPDDNAEEEADDRHLLLAEGGGDDELPRKQLSFAAVKSRQESWVVRPRPLVPRRPMPAAIRAADMLLLL